MSESKHTPGPWTWKDDIELVVLQEQYPMAEPIAVVTAYPAEAFANARLLAAAPDLLAALQSVLVSVPFASYRGDGELEECEQLVRTAIAKATA